MHKQPILLRRTASNVPSAPSSSGAGGNSTSILNPSSEPGSGGQVDPENAIPIADERPGVLSRDHKRKQSGIPLEAGAIINRASVQTSLEQITDEDEESGIIMTDRSRTFSEASGGGGGEENMPEFSELFPEDGWSLKSLLTSRGVAGVALLVVTYALFTMYSSSSTASTRHEGKNNPAAGGSTGHAGAGAGAGVSVPKSPQPDDKGITTGEYHEEIVGKPMEHKVNEYNKIRFFDSPDKMKPIISKGPILYDDDVGGLHMFENVCLTNNIDSLRYRPDPDTALRGLIYFTDEEDIINNPKRCVPCSNHQPLEDWESESNNQNKNQDEKVVGHKCGMNGLHAMFASSVGDWTECIMEPENTKLMEKWGQTQAPVNVSTIHFFQEPTFLLQFNAMDMEKSLFDMLLTYLPHWDKFLGTYNDDDDDEGGFPFDSVISHSLQGCLSHSHNWFCEVLHQMYAFGEAKEIPWESDDNTLYCYRELFYNQVGYQRNLDHEGLVTRENFGEFREMLFRKFGLPRRRTVEDRLADMEFEKSQNQGKNKNQQVDGQGNNHDNDNANKDSSDADDTKIIFYDNKLSEQHIWNQMESLISKARELEKFQNIKFVTVNQDFADLTVAQQARKFNEADAIIMARGQHMANAIFAVDGTSFVEVGCKVESLIGNPKFMELMDGKYRAVERCTTGQAKDGNICVVCREGDDMKFTMSPAAFEKLIDDVVANLEQ